MRSLSHVWRVLRRGSSLAAVAMLASAIGAVTLVFSIAHAVLIRPLPFGNADNVVMLWGQDESRGPAIVEVGLGDLRAWRAQNATLTNIEVLSSVNWSYRITAPGEPFSGPQASVSAGFFETLGSRAMLGRTFTADEDKAGARGTVVLSASLWRRRFSSDERIIGRSVTIGEGKDAQPYEVVGVMPPEFRFPAGADLWLPAIREMGEYARKEKSSDPELSGLRVFYALGRMKPGVTVDQVRPDLSAIARRFESDLGAPDNRAAVVVTPLASYFLGPSRATVLAIAAAVGVLLLIACANAAGLLLVQGVSRQREIAVRLAVGATRADLIRRLLAESAVLVLIAGIAGLALAFLSFDAAIALAPVEVPRLDEAALNAPAIAFTTSLCLLTTFFVGLVPAWQFSRGDLADVLRQGSISATGAPRAARSRQLLVVVQLAAAIVLLTAAGLLARNFLSLARLDLGFDPRNVLTFHVSAPSVRYPSVEQRRALVEKVLTDSRLVPGVSAAGAILNRPFANGPIGMDSGILLEGQPLSAQSAARNPILNWESITPDYFRAMDIKVVRGRAFDARDTERAPRVVIVSERTAARLWPGAEPIGKRVLTNAVEGKELEWQTVVGVVEDARYREIETPRYDFYVPFRQAESEVQHFVVRTSGEPLALVPTLKERFRGIDPELTLEGATSMEQIVERTVAPWWFSTFVFIALSAMALAFAAIGLFAVIAYTVRQRTREIGVRIALGARTLDVVGLLLKEGAALCAVGLAIGIPAAWALTGFLSSLLVSVTPTDPGTFAAAILTLAAVCLGATYLPARRAAAVDPVTALKAE